jgi:hypothetical protein
VRDALQSGQRLFGEKKRFVVSIRHKNRETVTSATHPAALAFLQMREGLERAFQLVLENLARGIARQSVAPEHNPDGDFEGGEPARDPATQLVLGGRRAGLS